MMESRACALRMAVPLLMVVALFLEASPVAAARAPDRIQRDALLSLECSSELRRVLVGNPHRMPEDIQVPLSGRSPDNRLVNVVRESAGFPSQIQIGPNWFDRAGAIPHDHGARYEFASEPVADPSQLPHFWRALAGSMISQEPEAPVGRDRKVFRRELCGQGEVLEVLVFRHLGEWLVVLRQGPVLPELRMNPSLD